MDLVSLALVASKNEARRLIQQGGARVDGEAVREDVTVSVDGEVRISAGRKKHGLLVPDCPQDVIGEDENE
ncbi:MAG: tyrosyl-tRNA synthetase [Sphingomonadales bacterium]|nr:tyrosyl-tRNA synthetase [Sphingomonadales bacterium]